MGKLSLEKNPGKNAKPRGNFRKPPLASRIAGVAGTALLLACSPGQQEKKEGAMVRCYQPGEKGIMVNSGGKEIFADASGIGVEGKPLAAFCTNSGQLFWVNKNDVFVGKLVLGDGKAAAEKILKVRHTHPDEYSVPGVEVVSADIWKNPDARWNDIVIATVTNTGLFQAARLSLKNAARNIPDRALYELSLQESWPKEGIKHVSVSVIGERRFVVIPLGEKGKGSVKEFYHISFEVERIHRFMQMRMFLDTMEAWKTNPGLKNIFAITEPVRHDRSLGGWVVNLEGEDENGKVMHIFPTVAPKE